MLNKNVKQSITALEIFTRLEDKLQTGEYKVNQINTYSFDPVTPLTPPSPLSTIDEYIDVDIKSIDDKIIHININIRDKVLYITTFGRMFVKPYKQELTDEEFENVKKRFIKLAQKQQDEFENWIKDVDNIF